VGDLGLDPRKCAKPSVICIVDTIQLWSPERYEERAHRLTAARHQPPGKPVAPDQIAQLSLAYHGQGRGIAAGVDEVIMLDSQGYVAEASGMNLFAVTKRYAKTPPAYAGILRGVTRDAVIELAREAT